MAENGCLETLQSQCRRHASSTSILHFRLLPSHQSAPTTVDRPRLYAMAALGIDSNSNRIGLLYALQRLRKICANISAACLPSPPSACASASPPLIAMYDSDGLQRGGSHLELPTGSTQARADPVGLAEEPAVKSSKMAKRNTPEPALIHHTVGPECETGCEVYGHVQSESAPTISPHTLWLSSCLWAGALRVSWQVESGELQRVVRFSVNPPPEYIRTQESLAPFGFLFSLRFLSLSPLKSAEPALNPFCPSSLSTHHLQHLRCLPQLSSAASL